MEGLNDIENFESFKNRIAEIFKTEGLSENLLGEIDRWCNRRQEETDRRGGTIEERVTFQMELTQLYIVTGRNGLAFQTLNDASIQADQGGLTDLKEKIDILINSIY